MNKQDKYLKIAQSVTQTYIMEYGMELTEIDELDRMIAYAIAKEVDDALNRFIKAI
jgi:hypothetical protein